MPEETQSSDTPKNTANQRSTTVHICACGEQHEEIPGSVSHRDACTSPKKFGDSCCCGSGEAARETRHRCGHGPRCQ